MLLPRSLAAPAAPAAAAPRAETVSGGPLRVLIVEDSDAVASLMAGMVEELGHVPARVASAPAALRRMDEAGLPDLVLSDVMMPGGMDGLGLAEELRRRHRGLPVVLASGRADMVRQAAERAAIPLLGKPFALADLAAAIAQARAGMIT
jgi:CheY-like chemotaxis protein